MPRIPEFILEALVTNPKKRRNYIIESILAVRTRTDSLTEIVQKRVDRIDMLGTDLAHMAAQRDPPVGISIRQCYREAMICKRLAARLYETIGKRSEALDSLGYAAIYAAKARRKVRSMKLYIALGKQYEETGRPIDAGYAYIKAAVSAQHATLHERARRLFELGTDLFKRTGYTPSHQFIERTRHMLQHS